MNLSYVKVVEVLPDRGGVRVQFSDLVYSGASQNDFVRVLQSRMSPSGGASLFLPEVGEFGVVAETVGGNLFWMGSLPFLDANQIDPTPGIAYWRHQSGLTMQARLNGDFEVLHPSNLRITVGSEGGPLPPLLRSGPITSQGGPVPSIEVDHPSGFNLMIGQDGQFSITFPSGSGIDFNTDGSVSIVGAGDIDVSGIGTARFSGSPNVEISGSDAVTITTLGDCSISAGNDVSVDAIGNGSVYVEGDLTVTTKTGNVSVLATAGNVSLTATLGSVTLLGTTPVNLTSIASITLTAPAISLMGVGTLNGRPIVTS